MLLRLKPCVSPLIPLTSSDCVGDLNNVTLVCLPPKRRPSCLKGKFYKQLDVFFYFFPPQTRSFWPSLSPGRITAPYNLPHVKSLSCVDIMLTLLFCVFMFRVHAVFILQYLYIRWMYKYIQRTAQARLAETIN